MFKYFKNIQKEIKHFDEIAKNPFTQYENKYNPCQNCISQTYIWIEEDIKKNLSSNPFVKRKKF